MDCALQTKKNTRKKLPVKTIVVVIASMLIVASFLIYLWGAFKYEVPSKGIDTPIALESGVEFRQKLPVSPGDTLYNISICFGTYDRKNTGILRVKLFSNQTEIQTWKIKSAKLKDNQYRAFRLKSPLETKAESVYEISITHVYEGDNQVAIWTNPDEFSEYTLNGTAHVGSACFSLACEKTALQTRFLIVSLIILSLLAFMIARKINEVAIMSCILTIMIIAYLCVFPLGIGADEIHHFFRSYEIANVGLLSKKVGPGSVGGDILPSALYNYQDENAVIDWNDTAEIPFQGAALYSPLSYLPQSIGIKIAGILTNKVNLIYRAGVYTSALLCLLLCIAALYYAPFGRRILFVFLMFPMTLEEIASISPDGMAISLSVFFIAYIGYLSYKVKAVRAKNIAVLFVAGMILSMCKIVYIVLLLLVFLIPNHQFKTKTNARLTKFGLIIIAGVMNLLWLKIASNYLIEYREGVNSAKQVLFVLSHPDDYAVIVLRTINMHLATWSEWMIGSLLGALNISIGSIVHIVFFALFIVTLCDCTTEDCKVGQNDAAIYMAVFLMGCVAIITSLYVQWTAVGHGWVEGVQGRYFTPLLGVLCCSVIILRSAGKQGLQKQSPQFPDGLCYYTLLLCMNGIALVDVAKYVFLS